MLHRIWPLLGLGLLLVMAPAIYGQEPNLEEFRATIAGILDRACSDCHGADDPQANLRVDRLDPDLVHGSDAAWWIEVQQVLSNREMPPEESPQLSDAERSQIIQWIAAETQLASQLHREQHAASAFRRMTSYETNYALQDLLGLPHDFAQDLPPENASPDGFQNSAEMLHMSTSQLELYRDVFRQAVHQATVRGPQPSRLQWSIPMQAAAARPQASYDAEVQQIQQKYQDEPQQLQRELEAHAERFSRPSHAAYYRNLASGLCFRAEWSYPGAKYAWLPEETSRDLPPPGEVVAVLPAQAKLVIELGNRLPDHGTLRIRLRASRVEQAQTAAIASLRWEFGFQASNNSSASATIAGSEQTIQAPADAPQIVQWDIPLSQLKLRNPMRHTAQMGETPSPSEYLRLYNLSSPPTAVQFDYVEITAPVYDQWPPASHQRLFPHGSQPSDETQAARATLQWFMPQAWRRQVSEEELEQKLALLARLRPLCVDYQEALIEVLATVLASPNFLYLVGPENVRDALPREGQPRPLSGEQLATRLSMFLWCSLPDERLRELAAAGKLHQPQVLQAEAERMLDDPRSQRFVEQFVRQWLGLQLLDYLQVDAERYPHFDPLLKEAMLQEPIAFFRHVLETNGNVLDFLHADYVLVNERLASHYGLSGVHGPHFRRVVLEDNREQRGGLLTQAGLLAMNSDGKDSHPLKRGIWILERLLNDPPPPPPPAVPEIDLADPEIAKMTLKQRLEDHRNDAACFSCHAKIDPWGISLENYDAAGSWRSTIAGAPVDASSRLANQQVLAGAEGLKRYLLVHRQDQFVSALVHKLLTFALGRPLTFSDRGEVQRLAAQLRQTDDGLATLMNLIVSSELFQMP